MEVFNKSVHFCEVLSSVIDDKNKVRLKGLGITALSFALNHRVCEFPCMHSRKIRGIGLGKRAWEDFR